ncbi:hypothetical protein [Cupriavidus basilensis]|uniref:hypothetical protein n=1 Tax=Cupriavidus basilensis TaxID=68895 RepID=UPI003204AFB0
MNECDPVAALQAENARLIALLQKHGIEWRLPFVPAPPVPEAETSRLSTDDKVGELDALPPEASRILLATGKLVGEGFDHPPLDTLVLAMPVSWKGTLQQYAGRLHREHATKTDVRIIDFVDSGHPALLRMWEKRQRGYRAMGYRMAPG